MIISFRWTIASAAAAVVAAIVAVVRAVPHFQGAAGPVPAGAFGLDPQVLTVIVSFLGGGAMGAVISAFASGWRERRRDAEQRRREFRGYLAELRSRIERVSHEAPKLIWDTYTDNIHRFHSERAKVWSDWPGDDFQRLCDNLGSLRFEQVTAKPGSMRDMIAEAIDALIKFTREA